MIFSLTRRSPSRCDIRRSPIHAVEPWRTTPLALGATCCLYWGEESSAFRVDTNCQRNRVTAPVTLVLGLGGHSRAERRAFLKSAPNMPFSCDATRREG